MEILEVQDLMDVLAALVSLGLLVHKATEVYKELMIQLYVHVFEPAS